MFPQNRFVKNINDIITSPYFAIILALISISIGLNIFIDRLLGLIAIAFILIVLLVFIFLLFVVSEKTLSGYIIDNMDIEWEIFDLEGRHARSKKIVTIHLTKPLEYFHQFLEPQERLLSVKNIHQVSIIADGIRPKLWLSLGAQHPKGTTIEFILETERVFLAMGNGQELTQKIQERTSSATSIPSDFYKQLLNALLDCGLFATNHEINTIFFETRISPWRNLLPEAKNQIERIESVVNSLYRQYNNEGKNALVLLLHVLSERFDHGNACHHRLANLANEWNNIIKSFDSNKFEDTMLTQERALNSKYVELYVHCRIQTIRTDLKLPINEDGLIPFASLYQRKKQGVTIYLDDISNNKNNKLEMNETPPWVVGWQDKKLDVNTDYLIVWSWQKNH